MSTFACTVEYLDTADTLGTVQGVLTLSESRPAKGTMYVWLVDEESPDGKPEQFDLFENAEVTEDVNDGSLRIHCDSMRAEGSFGVGQSRVILKVVPR